MACSFEYSSGDFEDFFEDCIQKYLDSGTKSDMFISGNFSEEFTSFLKRTNIRFAINFWCIPTRVCIRRREIHPSDDEDESDDFREFVVKCREDANPEETITLFKTSIRDYILSNSVQHYTKRFSSTKGAIISSYLSDRNVSHTVEHMEGFDDVVICILHETLYEM